MTFDIPVVSTASAMDRVFNESGGILRFAPDWVARTFRTPGRRIRLHLRDYFPLQKGRGGIDERWIAWPIRADNRPLTSPHEGLRLAVDPEGGLAPFGEILVAGMADVICLDPSPVAVVEVTGSSTAVYVIGSMPSTAAQPAQIAGWDQSP